MSAKAPIIPAKKCRRLEGKVAVVTASTLGIGLAIAERLGLEGAHVMVSSRKQSQVDAAVERLRRQGIDVAGTVCHVGKKDDRLRLFERTIEVFGGLDILVSNAAVNPTNVPILETTEESWDKVFEINVKASFFLCKEAIPYMEKRGGGSVVIVSSLAGYRPLESMSAYAVSKTTLLGLVKAMSTGLADKNIRVNGIAPGFIKTKFSSVLWDSPEKEAALAGTIPFGRLGVPEDCSGIVACLVSDDASYITGETVVIAGGMTSRL
jgi:dehydrogenase/reductase SDR family protein 4